MVKCACGATTDGEPWANGWGRYVVALDQPIEWRCNYCVGDHLLLRMATEWTLADGIALEEGLP